jgi:hypothetical protein
MRRLLGLTFVPLLLIPTAAIAQSTPTPVERQQAITANPFLLLGGWFNVEYERRINPTTTWGLSGSLAELENFKYRSAKFLFRYYPQEAALSGLFIGGRTGIYRVDEDTGAFLFGTQDTKLFFALGVELGYTWLLGREHRFAISLGGGLSRLFGGDLEDAPLTIPNIRLVNIGVAF